MTTATEVVLQSGMPVTALRLAPGISVRRTDGPVGVLLDHPEGDEGFAATLHNGIGMPSGEVGDHTHHVRIVSQVR